MKDKYQTVITVIRNFWKLALALSMVGLAAYSLYQVRESLSAIGVQVFVAITAAVVIVEGVIELVKFLATRKDN